MENIYINLDVKVCSLRNVSDEIARQQKTGKPFDGVVTVESQRAEDVRAMGNERPTLPASLDRDARHFILECREHGLFTRPEEKKFRNDLAALFDFVDALALAAASREDERLRLLLHCKHGNTRSVLVAILLTHYAAPGVSSAEVLANLSRMRPNMDIESDLAFKVLEIGERLIARRTAMRSVSQPVAAPRPVEQPVAQRAARPVAVLPPRSEGVSPMILKAG